MRSSWISLLVILLSLSLLNGNAHTALHLSAAHSDPCPEEHEHHGGHTSPDHQHQSDNGFACCCDCLGYTSVAQLPLSIGITPVEFASQIRFDAFTASLSSRAVTREPGPPRLGTPS